MTIANCRLQIAKPQAGRSNRLPWRVIWRAVFSAGVLAWLIYRIDWRPILHLLARVRFSWCLAALAIYCLAQFVSSWRWQILARALGFAERFGRYVSLYFIGMFFNLFLPTSVGGDVVRAWFLAGQRHKGRLARSNQGGEEPDEAGSNPHALHIPAHDLPPAGASSMGVGWRAALSVFSERFSGLLALLVIACFAAFTRPRGLELATLWSVWGTTAAALVGLLALPILGRWNVWLRSLAQGMSFYRGHLSQWAGAFGLSFVVQAMSIVQVWLLGKALAIHVPFLAYAVAVPVVSLLTLLPISINGVGVREGSLVFLLVPAGATQAGALALGLMWFFVGAVASLLGGGVYLMEGSHGSFRGDTDQGRERQSAAAA